jgi:hypothetical protein
MSFGGKKYKKGNEKKRRKETLQLKGYLYTERTNLEVDNIIIGT